MSLNKVMLIGNVGRDPEVRYLDGGANRGNSNSKVAQYTLATTDRYRDQSGQMKESAEWHNIVAFGNLADLSENYIRKGTQVFIEGRIRTRSWTDASNNKKYMTEIVASNIQLLGRRGDNPASGSAVSGGETPRPSYEPQRPAPQQPAPAPAAAPAEDAPEDDLPF
ncbi:MAG: single-stranded DNA-binding protein [Bacteroidales bacterium]|nr:single-stranded DNA-binding protein [Bacteroidales bacterium]